ncbi:MAG: cell division protein FtsQ/DivIB [Luteolibacter sp.]
MRTKSNKRRHQQNVLEVRVMTPRIAWIGLMRILGSASKWLLLLSLIAGIGWGIWRGIQYAFYHNPDFDLKVIDLNPNPVMDETDLVDLLKIDLMASPSLFEVDTTQARELLSSHPAITSAAIERHLPGTLMVRLKTRTPAAWLSSNENPSEPRRVDGLLVDGNGVAYPCPEKQLEHAMKLPVIQLDEAIPKIGDRVESHTLEMAMRLIEAARSLDADADRSIESIRRVNEWSLELTTRDGTRATFGLREHARQIRNLRDALDHAALKGYQIDTINLIPKHNIPITLRGDSHPPRAVIIAEPEASNSTTRQRGTTILNRR